MKHIPNLIEDTELLNSNLNSDLVWGFPQALFLWGGGANAP